MKPYEWGIYYTILLVFALSSSFLLLVGIIWIEDTLLDFIIILSALFLTPISGVSLALLVYDIANSFKRY